MRLLASIIFVVCLGVSAVTKAATEIFVQNDTDENIHVVDVRVNGDPLSSKAWKVGASIISPGVRTGVLSINRTGKFNWMDPTPRFIEPGNTVVFTVQLRSDSAEKLLTLKQKLLGTGAGSKLWYAINDPDGHVKWLLPFNEITGTWLKDKPAKLNYIYRAIETKKDNNLELVVTN